MSILPLPASITSQINKYLRNFLWRKFGVLVAGLALIAWEKNCKPRKQGGLGILDVSLHNKPLMMKNVQKFLNKEPLPWVQLIWEKYYSQSLPGSKMEGSSWWRSHLRLFEDYKSNSNCKLGNGHATLLWHDKWTGQPLKEKIFRASFIFKG